MSSLLTLWAIAQIVLGIGFLIFVHELGHFLVARWCGVRCEQFSIGFGPKIFSWTRGETEYRVAWIPLGGYVKMAGEHPGDVITGAPDELTSKSVPARAAIFSAGVAMNLIFAVVLFAVAFGMGVRFIEPRVGSAAPGTPAWHAGLEPGDRIVRIDGKEILNFDQIAMAVVFADQKTGMEIELEREGKRFVRRVYPVYQQDIGVQAMGVSPASRKRITVREGSQAWKNGLRSGDRILSIKGLQSSDRTLSNEDSDEIVSNRELIEALSSVTEKSFKVTYTRDGKRQTVLIHSSGEMSHVIGVVQAGTIVKDVRQFSPKDGKSPSVARRLGVQAEDRLYQINGKPIYSFRTVREQAEKWPASWGEKVTLILLRGKTPKKVELIREDAPAFFRSIASRSVDPLIGEVKKGMPAEEVGITPGSRVTEIDGAKITTWQEMAEAIRSSQGKALSVVWIDAAGGKHKKALTPALVSGVAGEIGFEFGLKLSDEVRYGVGKACLVGLEHSWEMTIKVAQMVRSLLTRKVSAKNLGGPIVIAQVSYAYIDRFGFGRFLYFLGLLSVNLVVLNLLPIPVLDGGHLLFLLIEAVKGKPVSEATMGIAQYIGFFLILALIIFVMANDILRLL